jgi:hypothetical protein
MAPGEDFIGPASGGRARVERIYAARVPKRRLIVPLRKAAAGAVIRRERRGDGRVETTKRRSCR